MDKLFSSVLIGVYMLAGKPRVSLEFTSLSPISWSIIQASGVRRIYGFWFVVSGSGYYLVSSDEVH